ncbi:MAG: DUF1517 domain-containing protein [Sandaracinus sp.]
MARPFRSLARVVPSVLAWLVVTSAALAQAPEGEDAAAQADRAYWEAVRDNPLLELLGLAAYCLDHPVVGVLVLVGLGVFVAWLVRREEIEPPGPQGRGWMNADVSVLRLVVDEASARFLRTELSKLGALGPSTSRAQLAEKVGRIVRLLRKSDVAWMYGGANCYRPMSPPIAYELYRRHTREAHSALADRLTRSERGVLYLPEVPAGDLSPASRDGAAMFTFVVAARGELKDFRGGERVEIHALLDQLETLAPADLLGVELACLPAAPGERIARTTLLTLAPDLEDLAPVAPGSEEAPRAAHCASCGAPLSRELPTCAHCGAAAP